jgi:hypothetical protein
MDQAGSIEAGRSTATDRHQPDPVSAKESDLAAATMPLRADLARAARLASFMVGLVGIAVLIGWAADLPILKSVLPGYSAMKPTTALSFILAALIFALAAQTANLPPSQPIQFATGAGAALLIAIGALTLIEYGTHADLGIDLLLFAGAVDPAEPFPGRISPISAISFVLFGILMLLPRNDGKDPGRTRQGAAAGPQSAIHLGLYREHHRASRQARSRGAFPGEALQARGSREEDPRGAHRRGEGKLVAGPWCGRRQRRNCRLKATVAEQQDASLQKNHGAATSGRGAESRRLASTPTHDETT